jgi:hypothetical protein
MRPAFHPLSRGTIDPADQCPEAIKRNEYDGGRSFTFEPEPDETCDKKLTAAKQEEFKADFSRELERLETWAAIGHWPPSATSALQVTVSHRFKISRSLVPAWYGRAGDMEFPVRRVVARHAAIAHELVHVFFPNGNRFLAEGLAVYLQAEIGGNPAFPNFGTPLHDLARQRMQAMLENARGNTICFEGTYLSALDEIATPNPLVLRVGEDFFGEDARGQGHIYPIAGSFVQFLIETRGLEMFRTLYIQTPFAPHALNAGAAERWTAIYGCPLVELESQWKLLLDRGETNNQSL